MREAPSFGWFRHAGSGLSCQRGSLLKSFLALGISFLPFAASHAQTTTKHRAARPTSASSARHAAPLRSPAETVNVSGLSRAGRAVAQAQKTPQSISVLTGAHLRDLGVTDMRQISNLTPNLYQPRATVGYSATNYFIRGIGELDPQGEPSVGTYIDGVYLPRTLGTMQELLDIEAISVERGPVGFTEGHQAEGGAVRITTETPTNRTHYAVLAGYGTYNEYRLSAAASGALVKDKVYASIALNHHGRGSIDHNYTLNRGENNIDYSQGRGKLRFTPNERLDITLAFDGTIDNSTNRGYGNLLNPYRYGLYSRVYPKNSYNQAGFTGNVNYRLDPHLVLQATTGIRGYDMKGNYDNFGDYYIRASQLLTYRDRSYSQDVHLRGDYGKLSFTAGAFFFYEDWFTQRRANNVAGTQTNDPASMRYQPVYAVIDQLTRNWAVYGQAQYRIIPTLTATAGLRFNWEDHSNSEQLSYLVGSRPYTQGIANNLQTLYSATPGNLAWSAGERRSWTQLLPKGALTWQATPRLMPYVSISQGSKSGGYDYRAQTPTALGRLQAVLPYRPEILTTYEIGAKTQPIPGRLTVNGDVFYNDFRDIQVTTLDPASGLSRRYNAGRGHSVGAEIETAAHITQAWEFDATASWLFSQLDHFSGRFGQVTLANGQTLNTAPRQGGPLPYSPRFQMHAGTSYTFQIPDFPGGWRVGADISYQSTLFTDALTNAQTRLPAQTYVNAIAAWTSRNKRWTVTVNGRNLLDHRYPQSLSFVQGGGVPVYYAAAFNDPRTIFASVEFRL
ncbi:TonB-dependent receptor [Kozakia baliensis]|uniref:TonB-dependent receptor n=1 Tax=Kozakia baliensis TaxID=153496 RepID=UPI00087AC95E|nr:TonB-dependent receptor [Kozakia baliensis]AOX20060.1 TonB-dependent receptor [Kozakia baliensis]